MSTDSRSSTKAEGLPVSSRLGLPTVQHAAMRGHIDDVGGGQNVPGRGDDRAAAHGEREGRGDAVVRDLTDDGDLHGGGNDAIPHLGPLEGERRRSRGHHEGKDERDESTGADGTREPSLRADDGLRHPTGPPRHLMAQRHRVVHDGRCSCSPEHPAHDLRNRCMISTTSTRNTPCPDLPRLLACCSQERHCSRPDHTGTSTSRSLAPAGLPTSGHGAGPGSVPAIRGNSANRGQA